MFGELGSVLPASNIVDKPVFLMDEHKSDVLSNGYKSDVLCNGYKSDVLFDEHKPSAPFIIVQIFHIKDAMLYLQVCCTTRHKR